MSILYVSGCTSIGNLQPSMVFAWASVNISVNVVPTLFTSDTPTLSCSLEAKDGSVR